MTAVMDAARLRITAYLAWCLTNIDCDESLMSSLERFQNVVLGGGEAGKYIAWELARLGQRVAVVEKGLIGGSCPNIACLPSKNVIYSAKVVELVRHAAAFGL